MYGFYIDGSECSHKVIECGKTREPKTEPWDTGVTTGWRREGETAKEMEWEWRESRKVWWSRCQVNKDVCCLNFRIIALQEDKET